MYDVLAEFNLMSHSISWHPMVTLTCCDWLCCPQGIVEFLAMPPSTWGLFPCSFGDDGDCRPEACETNLWKFEDATLGKASSVWCCSGCHHGSWAPIHWPTGSSSKTNDYKSLGFQSGKKNCEFGNCGVQIFTSIDWLLQAVTRSIPSLRRRTRPRGKVPRRRRARHLFVATTDALPQLLVLLKLVMQM